MRQLHLPRSLALFTSRFWPLRHSYSPRIQLVCAVAVCSVTACVAHGVVIMHCR